MEESQLKTLLQRFDWENPPEYPAHYPPPAMWREGFSGPSALRGWKKSLSAAGDLVMYVHVPFCREICGFCGFNAVRLKAEGEADRYLDLLEREVFILAPSFRSRKFMWLCFGGGTPSILSCRQLERLFFILRTGFSFLPGARVAFEAHPDSLDVRKIRTLARLGVDWLSIGVQTFDSGVLRRNGRRQDVSRVRSLVRSARKAGISNVQLDLLAGMPFQSEAVFMKDISAAAAIDPERIYLFPFQNKRGVGIAAEEPAWLGEAYRSAVKKLGERGYDISCGRWLFKRGGGGWPYSYDQGEKVSRRYYSVLGLGPGAISYARSGARYRNDPSPAGYGRRLEAGTLPVASGTALSARDEMINFILLGLLQRGELRSAEFRGEFGEMPEKRFGVALKRLEKDGIVARSRRGWLISDRENGLFAVRRALYPAARLKEAAARLKGPGPAVPRKAASQEAGEGMPAVEVKIPSGAADYRPIARRMLSGLRACGARKVVFSGDEPLAFPDILKLIASARIAGAKDISVSTSGPGLSGSGSLPRLKRSGLGSVEFMVEGSGEWAAALPGLGRAASAGLGTRLNFMSAPGDENKIGRAAKFFSSRAGVKRFRFILQAGTYAVPAAVRELRAAARDPRLEITAVNIPPCLVPRGAGFSAEAWRGGGKAGVFRRAGYVKPRICSECAAQADCPGVDAAFAAGSGLARVRPLKRRPGR